MKTDILSTADKIHDCGLYLPNNQFITKNEIDYMNKTLKELLFHEKNGHK